MLGYVVIFTVPFLRDLVLLEPGDTGLMTVGAVVGVCGAAVIEVVHRVLRAVAARRNGK